MDPISSNPNPNNNNPSVPDNSHEDEDLKKKYQEILDKYAQELGKKAQIPAPSDTGSPVPAPQPHPINVPSDLVDEAPQVSAMATIHPPENFDSQTFPQPDQNYDDQLPLDDESTNLPSQDNDTPPQTGIADAPASAVLTEAVFTPVPDTPQIQNPDDILNFTPAAAATSSVESSPIPQSNPETSPVAPSNQPGQPLTALSGPENPPVLPEISIVSPPVEPQAPELSRSEIPKTEPTPVVPSEAFQPPVSKPELPLNNQENFTSLTVETGAVAQTSPPSEPSQAEIPKTEIIPAGVQLPSDNFNPQPPETLHSVPKNNSNIFKYIFFLTLIIFIGVAALLAYTFLNKQKSIGLINTTVTPTAAVISPVPGTGFCELNDKKYKNGESFTAADGCNTCICQSDSTISCTQNDCQNPSAGTLKSSPTSTSSAALAGKEYKNTKYNFSLTIPSTWTGKYEVADINNTLSFNYTGNKVNKATIFSVTKMPLSSWENLIKQYGSESNLTGFLMGKDVGKSLAYVYNQKLENPYTAVDTKSAAEFQTLSGDVKTIVSSFKLLTVAPVSAADNTTKDWKSYTNTKYNLSLKYPSAWEFKVAPWNEDIILFNNGPINFSDSTEPPLTPVSLTVTAKTIADLVTQYKTDYQYQNFKETDTTVGTYAVKTLTGTVSGDSLFSGKINHVALIRYNSKTTVLNFTELTTEIKPEIFTQMLSTLKFNNL